VKRSLPTSGAAAEASLVLAIPDLLWPGPGHGLPHPADDLALPALAGLLSRAEARGDAAHDLDSALLRLFGLSPSSTADAPVGALTLPPGEAGDAYWLCADPIHLRPDRSRLVAFDRRILHLDANEAGQLAHEIETHFADRGWRLRAAHPTRWQLRLPAPPEILTTPLRQVVGRDIHPFLPTGPDARQWHGLINELQMLLHQSPVNRAREARGEPTVNSLWLWGGGTLPPPPRRAFAAVWSDQPLAVGLARHCAAPHRSLPQTAEQWLHRASGLPGVHLAIIEHLDGLLPMGRLEDWIARLEALERDWLAPLHRALKQGRLAGVTILPLDGRRFEIRPGRLRHWWRRTRPYRHHVHPTVG
jgi:hypothetical protein